MLIQLFLSIVNWKEFSNSNKTGMFDLTDIFVGSVGVRLMWGCDLWFDWLFVRVSSFDLYLSTHTHIDILCVCLSLSVCPTLGFSFSFFEHIQLTSSTHYFSFWTPRVRNRARQINETILADLSAGFRLSQIYSYQCMSQLIIYKKLQHSQRYI